MTHPRSDLRTTQEAAPTPPGGFGQTHWTLVFAAAHAGTPEAREAFGRLYQEYWQPVYGWIRRRGASVAEAEDLAQDFFADLLARNALEGLGPEGGRFRCFLVAALRHFLANAYDRAQAQKRGGGVPHVSMDAGLVEGSWMGRHADAGAEAEFDADWAWTIVNRVLARLQGEYQEAGRGALFEELREFLGGEVERRSHAEVARQHGITVNAVGVAIHRLRRRYGELLREEVNRTVSRPEEVMDEVRHLLAVVEQCPRGAGGSVPEGGSGGPGAASGA